MKAIQVSRFGGLEELALTDISAPTPGFNEVLVEIAYAGVNFIDVYMRNGIYANSKAYPTPLPMVIGMEGVGTVVQLGDGVAGVTIGDRVGYCLTRGSYADYAVVPAWRLVRIPDAIPLPIAAALMLQGTTAHYLTHSAFPLESGQSCLVHAGAGGVGQLLIQLAKLKGSNVIATVGNHEKAEIARARGADHVILYREEDFKERVLEITEGRGVDVVYDSVGKDTIVRSLHCVRRRGLCIMYGTSSGQVDCIEPVALSEAGSIFFTKSNLADYTASKEEINGRANDLFRMVMDGKLTVVIDREFPLGEVCAAHELLEARGSKGKLLLRLGNG